MSHSQAPWVREACRQNLPYQIIARCHEPRCRHPAAVHFAIVRLTLQHASKRLRQLECISGRGLVLGCASKVSAPVAHYVTLSARCVDGGEGSSTPAFDATWRLLYRSEAVGVA